MMIEYKMGIRTTMKILFITILYCLFLKLQKIDYISMYVYLLNDYTYMFFYSMILFINMIDLMDYHLEMHRFKYSSKYLLFKWIRKVKEYAIIFIVTSIVEIIFFVILDTQFNVITFVYRNIIFFELIIFVYYLICLSDFNWNRKLVILYYLLWNVFYFIFILFNESSFTSFNVFILIQKIDITKVLIFHFIFILIALVKYLFVSRRKGIKKWIENKF